jgi:hypothetical protein
MDKPHHTPTALCRNLAQTLKRLFTTVKVHDADNALNAPIDIIRRDFYRSSYLPRISEVSLFPDFENLDLHFDGRDDHAPSLSMAFQGSSTTQGSHHTLLPARSLSHFNLHEVYSDETQQPILRARRLKRSPTRGLFREPTTGIVQSSKAVLVHKKSSLLIRKQSLQASISNASLAESVASERSASTIRRSKRSINLRKSAESQPLAQNAPRLTPIPEHSGSSASKTRQRDSFHLVRHFASFCIIDISAPGCPVSAVSEDLEYIYDIKDRFVLNAQKFSKLSMDLSVGRDPDGNEVTYVLLYSPLISPETMKSHFIMVSAIDVSGYVHYAASVDSSLESMEQSRRSNSPLERSTPMRQPSSRSWLDERTDLLADELLHGCSVTIAPACLVERSYKVLRRAQPGSLQLDSEDIWTTIAREEGLICRTASAGSMPDAMPSRSQKQVPASVKSTSTLDYGDEKVLDTFIKSLQVLYSQYFLLACTPLNDQFYEICYVSPAVYASGEWISGHLSHTPFNLMHEFGAHLAAGKRFRTTLRWGNQGVQKQLFCVPLIGHQPASWICMLVDKKTLIRW